MPSVSQTDAGALAANAEDILYQERSAIRDNIPLEILVGACEFLLKRYESDFAVFIQSIPEIDPETLDPDNRDCPICWTEFTLQLKHDPSTHGERDPTPLRLPCAHHVCKSCTYNWLPRVGTCPLCRQQFGPQNDIHFATDHEKWFRLREPYEAIAEIAPIYLASNPQKNTFGEFMLWLFASQSDDPDALQTRAQLAMNRFQVYTMGLSEALRHDPAGRQLLMKFRVGSVGRASMEESGNEDEVRSDEGDIVEEDLETPGGVDAVSEGYSGNGEGDGPTDDDREESMGSENADTAVPVLDKEEDLMDEREDQEEEDLMDENEDNHPAAAALAEEEDFTDEGEDFDEMGDDEDDWEHEFGHEEQNTPAAVLGCAALVTMVGMGLMMTL